MTDKQSFRARVQKFGSYLSGMIMPNIGAFIAWGLITALFIPTGWFPNKSLATLVDPTIKYLLPLLIGYTGGRLVYDVRGGVIGAIATMGVVVGADIPMFLGAMIVGPLGGYLMKKVDGLFVGKVRSGFEMLVNNFSAGILGAILALLSLKGIGPIVLGLNKVLAAGVEVIVNAHLLPLANIFIEPAKILFLNNAINHGILSPIGIDQAAKTGKSILFLLETNPGPGLGILLAYWLFGRGNAKQSAPGSAIIHFLGGIHEIYFPYVLMNPLLILAVIAGGVSAVFVFTLFGAGLVAVPSPGSVFALLAMTPKGNYLGVISGILTGIVVSFAVASLLINRGSRRGETDFDEAKRNVQEMKGKKEPNKEEIPHDNQEIVNKIVFACDAGMGSSAMGASILRKKMKEAQLPIEVTNTSISQLPSDADIVITQINLTERAKSKLPEARHISVENFLNSPEYDRLTEALSKK
jgi:PTS system mannitol-specific IIC component